MRTKSVKNEKNASKTKLLACRGCLATTGKLYNLQECQLVEIFGVLVGIWVTDVDGLPQHACVNCIALLRKFLAYRNKCKKVQELLEIKANITTEDIKKLHTENLSHLCRTHVINIDCVLDDEVSLPIESETISEEDEKIPLPLPLPLPVTLPLEKEIDDKNDGFDSEDDNLVISQINVKNDEVSDHSGDDFRQDDDFNDVDYEVEKQKESKSKKSSKEKKKERKESRKPRKKETQPRKRSDSKSSRKYFNYDRDAFLKEFKAKHNVEVIELTKEQQMQAMEERKRGRNYVTAPFKCDICYRGFVTDDGYNSHVGAHSPSRGAWECGVCRYRYRTDKLLAMHQRKHIVRYVCNDCGVVSTCNQDAIRHHQWHNGHKYTCKYCDIVFEKRTALMSHVHKKHEIDMDMCELCGAPYMGKLGLIRHRLSSHAGQMPETRPEDKCTSCGIQFLSAEALRNHCRESCHQNTMSCVTCGDNFPTKVLLKQHLTTNHGKHDPNREYKCDECGTSYLTMTSLGKHIQSVHLLQNAGDEEWKKKYVCETCGKRYPFPGVLRRHQQRAHSGDKAFECSQCPKAFHTTTNRRIHMRTHTGERPYECKECRRSFSSQFSLQRHFRVHTGEKPYSCPQCGKSFTQSNSMKLHVTTVHLKLPAPYKSKTRRERERRDVNSGDVKKEGAEHLFP